MAVYGYVKRNKPLPTNDQLKIVSDYRCETIFIESARNPRQEEFQRMLKGLKPGDTIVIASLEVFGTKAARIADILTVLRSKEVQVISWSTQLHLNYYKRTAGLL